MSPSVVYLSIIGCFGLSSTIKVNLSADIITSMPEITSLGSEEFSEVSVSSYSFTLRDRVCFCGCSSGETRITDMFQILVDPR